MREIDHNAAAAIELDQESFGAAVEAASAAVRAGLEPQEELRDAIRAYLQAEREREWGDPPFTLDQLTATALAWIKRKYTQSADARQRSMGLSYTTAETQDLAASFARFAMGHVHVLPRNTR